MNLAHGVRTGRRSGAGVLRGRPTPTQSSPMISILASDRLRLERDGTPLSLTPFQEACLLVVAESGSEGIARDRVAELLWSEPVSDRLLRRLRQLFYEMKKAVGAQLIGTKGGALRLTDGVEYQREEGGARARCPVPSHELQEWVEALNDSLRRRWQESAEQQCELAIEGDQPESILALTEHATTPLSPTLARHRVWALHRLGRAGEARAVRSEFLATSAWSVVQSAPPFVGRNRERDSAVQLLQRPRARVLLRGEDGSGRSRLMSIVSATALSIDPELVGLRAPARPDMAPFGLMDEIVQASPEVRSVLEEEALTVSQLLSTGAVSDCMERSFRRAFGPIPVLVEIDDMDFADRASLEVLSSLQRSSLIDLRVVGACGTLTTPFTEAGTLIELGPLDDAACLEAVRALRPDLTDEAVVQITGLAAGMPGRLEDLATAWVVGAGSGFGLGDHYRSKMDAISDEAIAVLRVLALSTGPVPVSVVAAAMRLHDAAQVQATVLSELRDLVRVADGWMEVPSSMLRSLVAGRIPPALVREIHLDLARGHHELGGAPGAIGRHLVLGGDLSAARAAFMAATEEALVRGAPADAYELICACPAPGPSGRSTAHQELRARAAAACGRHAEAADLRIHLIECGAPSVTEIDLARSCLLAGRDDAIPRLKNAVDAGLYDGADLARALEIGIMASDYQIDPESMRWFRDRADAFVRENGSFEGDWLGSRFVHLGEPERGLDCAISAWHRVRGERSERECAALNRLLAALVWLGGSDRVDEAEVTAVAGQLATATSSLALRFNLITNRALRLAMVGDYRGALVVNAEASARVPVSDVPRRLFLELNKLELYLAAGLVDLAEETVEAATALLPSPRRIDSYLLLAGRTLVNLERGRLRDARASAKELASLDLRFPHSSWPTVVLQARVRCARALGDKNGASFVVEEVKSGPLWASGPIRDAVARLT